MQNDCRSMTSLRSIDKNNNKTKTREGELRRKFEAIVSSPVFQKRLSNALSTINDKLMKQQRFFKLLDASEFMKKKRIQAKFDTVD